MSWFKARQVKKFIENPDSVLVVNPRFCEHDFIGIDKTCIHCGIKKEIIDNYFFIWDDAFKVKKENEIICYDKKLGMYFLEIG